MSSSRQPLFLRELELLLVILLLLHLRRRCGESFSYRRNLRLAQRLFVGLGEELDDVVDFVATGGYALKSYERFARIKQDRDGRWRVTNPRVRQSYRLNVGTIVEEQMLKVKLVRSRQSGGRILSLTFVYPTKHTNDTKGG